MPYLRNTGLKKLSKEEINELLPKPYKMKFKKVRFETEEEKIERRTRGFVGLIYLIVLIGFVWVIITAVC